jgi:hypothetical protein
MNQRANSPEPLFTTPLSTVLGLPVANRGLTLGCVGLVWLLYVQSMSRGVSLYDSGELALAAAQWGLGHPFGQPLHVWLGWVFAHVPGLAPLVGLNLLSATLGALSIAAVISIADRLSDDAAPSQHSLAHALPRYAVIVFISLHGSLWEPVTRIEVYPIANFFALWALARVVHAESETRNTRTLALVGGALGLSACANPVIAFVCGLGALTYLLPMLRARTCTWQGIAAAFVGGVVGLVPYAHVLVVAPRAGVMVWGGRKDNAALHHYFGFADFQQNNAMDAHQWLAHASEWLAWSTQHGITPWLLLGLIGYSLMRAPCGLRAWHPVVTYCGAVAFICSNVVWRPDVLDYLGYLSVGHWLCAAGVSRLVALCTLHMRRGMDWALALAVAALSLTSRPGVLERTRHLDLFVDSQAAQVLAQLPKRAIALVQSDHLAGALLFQQQAQHMRPDAVVIIEGLTASSWYWQLLFSSHPDLHRIKLAGAGGRTARLQRLLNANTDRVVLSEKLTLAQQLSTRQCARGWLFGLDDACDTPATPALSTPSQELGRWLARVGHGSPGTDALIAMVAYQHAEGLHALGDSVSAFKTLTSGVPRNDLPPTQPADIAALSASPALQLPPLHFRQDAALGDPARNLALAGLWLAAAHRNDSARAYLSSAADLGLSEALDWLGALPQQR